MLEHSDILEARERVRETSRHTPLEHSHTYSSMTGADIRLKLENFQRTGAFKIRGATNRIATLSAAQKEAGVVTASAGNHAQGSRSRPRDRASTRRSSCPNTRRFRR